MGVSREEYWSGLPFHPPGDLPDPGIQPGSPALAGRFFTTDATREAYNLPNLIVIKIILAHFRMKALYYCSFELHFFNFSFE